CQLLFVSPITLLSISPTTWLFYLRGRSHSNYHAVSPCHLGITMAPTLPTFVGLFYHFVDFSSASLTTWLSYVRGQLHSKYHVVNPRHLAITMASTLPTPVCLPYHFVNFSSASPTTWFLHDSWLIAWQISRCLIFVI